MKILHINCNYIGTKLHRSMIEHLNLFGIESTVYTPVCEKENEDVTTQDCQVIVSKCFKKWHRVFFDYKQELIFRDLQSRLDCSAYDCLHAYTLFTDGNCARRIGRKYGIPYVVAVRDTDVNVFLKKAFYLRGRAVNILRDASAVFFLSEGYRKQVLETYVPKRLRGAIRAKSRVIPNGIDDFWLQNRNTDKLRNVQELHSRILSDRSLRVVCAGVINHRKNHLATQEALQLLRQQGWSVRYQIVGKVLDQKLFEKIMAYPDTEYIPQQPKETLLEYYRQNDLFVMPSLTETFGLVYAEAMSQGLPVIYTRAQGFDGQFEEGEVGYAVDANDPAEIAERIKDAVQRYRELAENCLQLANTFNWADICEQYRAFYSAIAPKNSFASGGRTTSGALQETGRKKQMSANSHDSKISNKEKFRQIVAAFLYHMPKKTARSVWFAKQHGYRMNFKAPQTLDEKLNWLLVYHIGEEHARYVDKVAVRDFVAGKGLEELLPKVYGVWSHAAEIPLEELPDRFVLKCNHASGSKCYEIVRDKGKVDWPLVLKRLEAMLHINYARTHCEYQYKTVQPLIYAEELLDDGRDVRMTDYKVYCYYGKPHCIMLCTGRGRDLKRVFYDTDWNYLDYAKGVSKEDADMEKPRGLEKMLAAAAVLSQSFPFARMDFYDVDGKVYFGEITLTPDNCNIQHLNPEGQRRLGELLDLKRLTQS